MKNCKNRIIMVQKPIVISPSRKKDFKKGTGFSLKEVNKSNKTLQDLKSAKIKIDFRRKSEYQQNIEYLNNLKLDLKKKPKREPYRKKEEKPKKIIKKKVIKKPPIKLTLLNKLGPSTEKKMIEIGIPDVQTLIKEDPKEVASLVSGCSEERVIKWIEEGKRLVE